MSLHSIGLEPLNTEGTWQRARVALVAHAHAQTPPLKNTRVDGMVDAGILVSKRGRVRLLRSDELTEDWDPATDTRLTAWETVHYLVRALVSGEAAAADLVAKLGSRADTAKELAYRAYTLCERKKRAAETLSYNALVQSWPELVRLAAERGGAACPQARRTRPFRAIAGLCEAPFGQSPSKMLSKAASIYNNTPHEH
jgi:adenine-specific DNA methylase